MRRARVKQKHFPHVVAADAAGEKTHGRQADTVLEDAGRVARLATGNAASDIRMMGDGEGESDRLAVDEDWRRRRAIIEMDDTDDVGIVGKKDVARRKRVNGKALKQRGNELQRCAELRRRMSRYRKRAASHVAQGGRAIGAFLYIGRI